MLASSGNSPVCIFWPARLSHQSLESDGLLGPFSSPPRNPKPATRRALPMLASNNVPASSAPPQAPRRSGSCLAVLLERVFGICAPDLKIGRRAPSPLMRVFSPRRLAEAPLGPDA